jgi:hypothetical protein
VAPHVEQRADTRLSRVIRTIRDIDLSRLRPTG